MRTVLGLSKTSTSIGWVLVSGGDVAGEPLDHDAFDIADSSAAAPAATARRVRDIATATGYTVDSVHVTTSGNASSLREALTESGFDDVVSVSLPDSTRAWAMDTGRARDQKKTAVCILGRDSASLSVVDTFSGAIQATTTTASRDGLSLVDWLNASLGNNGSRPEALYLIGSRAKLEALALPLDTALHIPVIADHDAQLALARGAAFSDGSHVEAVAVKDRSALIAAARVLGVVAAVALASVFTLSAASAPSYLAQNNSHRPASSPPAKAAEVPTTAAPVAPVFSPPPAPLESAPIAIPQPQAQPKPRPEPPPVYTVAPQPIAPQPVESTVAPQEQPHLPDAQPVQHLPDAQPAAAPGPIAPPPPGPLPSDALPPPPPDPMQQVLSPLFDSMP